MQLTAKLKNKSTAWSAQLRPRVLDVVSNSGNYYQNVSGFNGDIADTAHWFPIYKDASSTSPVMAFDRNATNITGADPDFQINLSGYGIPAFPTSIRVYVDLNNTGDFEPLEPANYSPVTSILHGMNDPVAYPNQKIKIMII